LVDIFYPSTGTVFSKEGVFQQPQAFTSTTDHWEGWQRLQWCGLLLDSSTAAENYRYALPHCGLEYGS
jgi:hypothetical protein